MGSPIRDDGQASIEWKAGIDGGRAPLVIFGVSSKVRREAVEAVSPATRRDSERRGLFLRLGA